MEFWSLELRLIAGLPPLACFDSSLDFQVSTQSISYSLDSMSSTLTAAMRRLFFVSMGKSYMPRTRGEPRQGKTNDDRRHVVVSLPDGRYSPIRILSFVIINQSIIVGRSFDGSRTRENVVLDSCLFHTVKISLFRFFLSLSIYMCARLCLFSSIDDAHRALDSLYFGKNFAIFSARV